MMHVHECRVHDRDLSTILAFRGNRGELFDMKMLRYTLATLVLSTSVGLVACGGAEPDPDPAVQEIAQEDVVELGDLITQDPDASAAAEMTGDPAIMLAEAKKQGEKARGDVAAVLGFVKQLAAEAPVMKGAKADGKAFSLWKKAIAGKDTSLLLVRVEPGRFRYLVAVENADGTRSPLLAGIFVKKGPGTGGGRFHVNLTNVSNAFGAPEADGSIHFWFANHKGDKRGRRIAYRNVVRRDDPDKRVVNYGADLVRLVGVGGRFRSVGVGDFVQQVPGKEAMGLRVLWKAGEGGRASAAVATIGPMKQLLGIAHECWDMDGKRTAYSDDNPNNDADQPNEGVVTMCAGLAQESPTDQGNVSESGMDIDPQLNALLEESGAMDIDEAEANIVTDENDGI